MKILPINKFRLHIKQVNPLLLAYYQWKKGQIELFDLRQGTNEEKILFTHKTSFGGTADSVLLGCNKWKSKEQLYNEIVGDYRVQSNAKMRVGILLEGEVRDTIVSEILKGQVVATNLFLKPDLTRPWSTCQVDATISYQGQNVPCEIKTTGRKSGDWGKGCEVSEDGTILKEDGIIPFYYYVQCQKQLWATGAEFMFLLCRELAWCKDTVYLIRKDAEIIKAIHQSEDDFFINHILPKIPPVVQQEEVANDVAQDGVIYKEDLTEKTVRLAKLDAQAKDLKAQIEELTAQILEQAQAYKKIVDANGMLLASISKRSGSKTFDSKKFKEDQPDLYKQYLKTSDKTSYSLRFSNELKETAVNE